MVLSRLVKSFLFANFFLCPCVLELADDVWGVVDVEHGEQALVLLLVQFEFELADLF